MPSQIWWATLEELIFLLHIVCFLFFFSGPLIVTWLTTGCLWICTLEERSTQLCTYSMLGFSAIFAMTWRWPNTSKPYIFLKNLSDFICLAGMLLNIVMIIERIGLNFSSVLAKYLFSYSLLHFLYACIDSVFIYYMGINWLRASAKTLL